MKSFAQAMFVTVVTLQLWLIELSIASPLNEKLMNVCDQDPGAAKACKWCYDVMGAEYTKNCCTREMDFKECFATKVLMAFTQSSDFHADAFDEGRKVEGETSPMKSQKRFKWPHTWFKRTVTRRTVT